LWHENHNLKVVAGTHEGHNIYFSFSCHRLRHLWMILAGNEQDRRINTIDEARMTTQYSTNDLAQATGISRRAILFWIKTGKLKSTPFGGPKRPTHRITPEDWSAFLVSFKDPEAKLFKKIRVATVRGLFSEAV
jgi:hypothetical protein